MAVWTIWITWLTDLTALTEYKALYPAITGCALFPQTHKNLSQQTLALLDYKASFNEFERLKIIDGDRLTSKMVEGGSHSP